jgi:membrane-associated phospholipid phosphatase
MKGFLLAVALLGPVQQLDLEAQRVVQSWRQPALERPARALTDYGRPVIVAGSLILIAILDRASPARTAGVAALALLPVNLAVEGLKRLTYRQRPDGEHKRSNASFPSSHAANAFTIATVFARRWRRAAIPLFALATAVAFARMVLDRHWLSDCVVGAALGIGLALLTMRWLERRARRRAAAVG